MPDLETTPILKLKMQIWLRHLKLHRLVFTASWKWKKIEWGKSNQILAVTAQLVSEQSEKFAVMNRMNQWCICLVDNKVKISWGYRGITFNNYLNCQEEQGGLFWELYLFLSWAKYVRIVHLVFGASSCLSFIRNKLDLAFVMPKLETAPWIFSCSF